MIQLRPEQIAAFQRQAETGLLDRIVQHVRTEHAVIVNGFPDPTVREMVQNGIARARRYGLTWESSLTAFVGLMFAVAPNFDEQPAIHGVLTDGHFAADERIERLLRLRDRHWNDARSRYDERAWFPELYSQGGDGPEPRRFRIKLVRP